jgi:hypothetical protein
MRHGCMQCLTMAAVCCCCCVEFAVGQVTVLRRTEDRADSPTDEVSRGGPQRSACTTDHSRRTRDASHRAHPHTCAFPLLCFRPACLLLPPRLCCSALLCFAICPAKEKPNSDQHTRGYNSSATRKYLKF